MTFNKLFTLLIALLLTTPIWAQLSRHERKITKAIEKNSKEATALLLKTINMNSGSMNLEGVKAVGKVFRQEFDKLGFTTEWIDGAAFNRAGHLIATYEGRKAKGSKLLLIGHLDTVFEPDNPYQEYEIVSDSIVRGPGIADMKGGDVMILYALRALKEAGQLDRISVKVVFTGDEEKSGSPLELARKDLKAAADWADIALGFENGDSNYRTAVVSRRGSTSWELNVTGNAAHSSQVFSSAVGAGAIYETSRVLYRFYERLRGEEFLTYNPGVILGGTQVEYNRNNDGGSAKGKSNVVAKDAVVRGDIRAVSLVQLARAKKIMEEVVNASLPGTKSTLTWGNSGYPPLSPSNANNELLAIYSQISQDLGLGQVTAVAPINAGAADISFAEGLVDAAMDGLGLSGGKDHTIDEFGEIKMLGPLTKRAALLMLRVSGK